MYHRDKIIESRWNRHSTFFTAFDVEIFAIVKALQILKAKLFISNPHYIKKVDLYTNSSLSLKLLSFNLSSFIYYPLYV